MARRYARDNKGRFASAGTGATARGGRLRTAAGNKRATQTQQIKNSKPSGAIGKKKESAKGKTKSKSGQTSTEQAKSNYKAAFDKEQKAREAYFKTQFGTPEHTAARAKLDAATAKSDSLRNKWRDTKAQSEAATMPATSNTPASTSRANTAAQSPRTRRIKAEKSKYTAYAAKQFRADKTGIGELTVAQVSSKNWKLPRSMRKK